LQSVDTKMDPSLIALKSARGRGTSESRGLNTLIASCWQELPPGNVSASHPGTQTNTQGLNQLLQALDQLLQALSQLFWALKPEFTGCIDLVQLG
jgi:tRNA(Met) C34 N-acetyltransferase TmcA